MRIGSTPSARAVLCLLAAALLVTSCTSDKPPKLIIASTAGGPAGGYDLAGTLPDQPTHARIYRWPSTKPSQSDVEKLASVLGLSGMPARHAHGWDLTSANGELKVRDDQGRFWYYGRGDQAPCGAGNFDIDDLPGDAPHYMCATDPSAVMPTSSPNEAATKAAAARLLTALGVGGDEQFFADQGRSYLNVSPKVAGLPTQGIEISIEVDAIGVTSATAHSAPTACDEYTLRTAKAALDSLAAPPHPANSSEPIEIGGAYLGLDVENKPTPAGAKILVPTWVFTLADGSVAATAVAIDPAYIGSPPEPSIVITGGGGSRAPKPASS